MARGATTASTPKTSTSPTRTESSRRLQPRSEEHTSELQSPCNLVCRLLLEKKKNKRKTSSIRVKATLVVLICFVFNYFIPVCLFELISSCDGAITAHNGAFTHRS